jgi:hypothetical protein
MLTRHPPHATPTHTPCLQVGQVQGAAAWSNHAWQQANSSPQGSSASSSSTQPVRSPAGSSDVASIGTTHQPARSSSSSSSPYSQHGLPAPAFLRSQPASSAAPRGLLPQAGRWLSRGSLLLGPTSCNPSCALGTASPSRGVASLAYDQYYISKDTLAPVEAHKVDDIAKVGCGWTVAAVL